MAGVESALPSLELSKDDVIATFAGIRPVIGTGKADPSEESREHVIWEEEGLVTVTGGKLTTFRLIACDVLRRLRRRLPALPSNGRIQDLGFPITSLDPSHARRLLGRQGADASAFLAGARPEELKEIPGTRTLWAELRWAARAEGVVHLDDLLLRRVRLGLLLAGGGLSLIEEIRAVCQDELGWTASRWEEEVAAYGRLWHARYNLPEAVA